MTSLNTRIIRSKLMLDDKNRDKSNFKKTGQEK